MGKCDDLDALLVFPHSVLAQGILLCGFLFTVTKMNKAKGFFLEGGGGSIMT